MAARERWATREDMALLVRTRTVTELRLLMLWAEAATAVR
jgi:hypothetical protein